MILGEYYHLKKDAFSIDPRTDASVYFGGSNLRPQLIERIKSDFVQQRQVPKFCIYGRYGAGKTHTLHHIEHVLKGQFARDFPTEPINLEIAPIRAKESWSKVHRDLINAIGLDRLKRAVASVFSDPSAAQDPIAHLQQANILRFGEAAIQNSQAQVFRALLYGGRGEALALEWLKGATLSMDHAQTLGTETNLSEPSHLIHCLLNVANMLRHGLGGRPVVLIDEAEALLRLTNADSLGEFTFAFRKLFDDDNDVLGIVVAFQVEGGMEDAPGVLSDEAVMRRIGYETAYFDLARLVGEIDDARQFILEVLAYLVDQERARETIERAGMPTEPEFFPFTEDAVTTLADFVTQEPQYQLPSQIISRMSEAVVKAWLRGDEAPGDDRVLVDDELLNEVLYPEAA